MSRTGSRRIQAAERRVQALALRREGATFTEIGEALGINRSAAHKAVSRALDELAQLAEGEVVSLRALELDRLDALQRSIWTQAMDGALPAVDRLLRIMERRAKLLGLDAPVKQQTEESQQLGVLVLPEAIDDIDEWVAKYGPKVDAPTVDVAH
jgi:hypothetical protein